MKSLVDDLCDQVVQYSFIEIQKKKNKEKIKFIVDTITSYALKAIRPYLYTIMILLIVMFFINAIHFYYYLSILRWRGI
ncbi:MAG: hypothetical protein EBU90_02005 [Proteobacteria bacterium]|nr:hypothetical protein [Pseudomonadota bacterium]NBP13255.1 hypothetical protein [bacterium]